MRLILPPMWLAIALSVSGCWNSASEFMREPFFSPVGAGLAPEETAGIQSANALAAPQPPSTGPPPSLYSQPRIAHVGDIVRVIISINDKATLDNASGRSQTNKDGVVIDFGYNSGSSSSSSNQPSKALGDLSTQSSTQGQGNIDRSEQIQVSVAAIVTRVLANGNLVISGSQEVRVNYELRQLTVAGIVNPLDISLNNTVAYDRIAEARIAYGGRGRSNDFQQPPWGQQIYDTVEAVLAGAPMSDSALPQGAAAGNSLKASLIELAVVVILAAFAGAAFEASRAGAPPGADKPAESSAGASPAEPSTIVDLPPIVTNLGAPQDTWVRLEGSIIFDPGTLPHPDAVAGRIGDDILAYLRTVSLRQLEGPIGLENIRQDLNERAAIRSDGKVRAFVIRTLVVQ